MATKKVKSSETKTPTVLTFNEPDTVPAYINNVRIKTTSDNVFIDFGFVDPFAPEGSASSVLQRVVMNRTTFGVFAQHVAGILAEVKTTTTDISTVVMSRCPPRSEK